MNIQLSEKVNRIKPSPTLAVTARAMELKAMGEDIISLSAGEPDFDTPEHIKLAAIKALHDGLTKYTAVDGTPQLKQAICKKFAQENQLQYEPKQILVSAGAKQAIFNLCEALLNPGDEVIIPAPYWVSYPDIALLTDGIPVFIETDINHHFKITPTQLEAAITPRTRLLILNSPSNPSGIAYNKAELQQLAQVLLKHPQVIILTDDIYEHILWTDAPFVNILNACPELYQRTIVINGVSKAYAMTGWRIGYAAGPASLISAMSKVQSQTTSNANSIAQAAATVALTSDQQCVKAMCQSFKERHDFVVEQLNAMHNVHCLKGDGTFYAFVDVRKLLQARNMKNDVELAEYLLREAKVAVIPGSAFGLQGYIRISYSTSMTNLQNAMQRIKHVTADSVIL